MAPSSVCTTTAFACTVPSPSGVLTLSPLLNAEATAATAPTHNNAVTATNTLTRFIPAPLPKDPIGASTGTPTSPLPAASSPRTTPRSTPMR
jgi:hypothetical protein